LSKSRKGKKKDYLVARPFQGTGRKAVYCFEPKPELKALLMKRLSGGE